MSTPLAVTEATTIDVASGKTVTFDASAVISGASAITKTGAGKLLICSANGGFSGGFVIEKGYLIASNATALGTVAVEVKGHVDGTTDDCILGLWGTGKESKNGITYANAVNVTGNSTIDYPALIVYGQGAKLTGKVTAVKDFCFYDDHDSTKAISSAYSDRANYVTSLTFGEVAVGGMLFHDGWTTFIFGGKVTAPCAAFPWKRSSRFSGSQSNHMSAYAFNAASEIGIITNGNHNITLGANSVFNGTKYVIAENVTARSNVSLAGHPQRFESVNTPATTSADVLKASTTRAISNNGSATTITIDGGGEMPAGATEYRATSFETLSDKLSLVIDAYEGFTQTFSGRTNTMDGAITVTKGALEIGPNSLFNALTSIEVGENGSLTVDAARCFPKVTSLKVNGRLCATSADAALFNAGGDVAVELGEKGFLDLGTCVMICKSLKVNGVAVGNVHLTHETNPEQLAEGTELLVGAGENETISEDMTAQGDWSVIVGSGFTTTVAVPQTGAGKIIKYGSGTLTFASGSAGGTFSGGIELVGGHLRVEADNALGTGTVTVHGQTSTYTGVCQVDIVGAFIKAGDFTTVTRTVTNDFHFIGPSSMTYPGLVFFYQNSVMTGRITADSDFCFIEDLDSTKEISSSYYNRYSYVKAADFKGDVTVAGRFIYDGWVQFHFYGSVTAGIGDFTYIRPGSNNNAELYFHDKVTFGSVMTKARNLYTYKGMEVEGLYHATTNSNAGLTGGTIKYAASSDISFGGMDTSERLSADTVWCIQPISGTSATTLTITGLAPEDGETTREVVTHYLMKDKLSIVIDSQYEGFTQTFRNRINPTTGTLTVKRGTMKMTGTSSFSSATALTVEENGVFINESITNNSLAALAALAIDGKAVFDPAALTAGKATLSLGENAELDLGAGGVLTVKHLTVNGYPKPAGTFDASVYPQIKSGTVVALNDAPNFEPTPAVWNGTSWEPANVNPLDGTIAATFDKTVSSTTFDSPVRLYGITFASDLAGYAVSGSGSLSIGSGGITIGDASGAAHEYAFSLPMSVIGNQTWTIPAKGKLVFDSAIGEQSGFITVTGGKTSSIACDLVFRGTNVIAGGMSVKAATLNVVDGVLATPDHVDQGTPSNGGDKTVTILGNDSIGKASIYLDSGTIEKPMYLTYSGDSVLRSSNNTTNFCSGCVKWSSPWLGFRPGKNAEIVFTGGFTTGWSMRSFGTDSNSVIRIRDKPIVATESAGWNINSGKVALDVAGNKFSYFSTAQNGSDTGYIDFGVSYAFTNSSNWAFLPGFYFDNDYNLMHATGGAPKVYFHSTTQQVSTLAGGARATLYADEGARLEVLKQTSPSAAKMLPNDRIYFSSQIEGPLTLEMNGDGELPLILTNQTFHSTGSLVVSKGVLELANNASWVNGIDFVTRGSGLLRFTAAGQISTQAQIHFGGEGKIEIPAGVTNRVSTVDIDGDELPNDVYTGTEGPLAGRIIGGGALKVGKKGMLLMIQ